jgi:hypothetical protein
VPDALKALQMVGLTAEIRRVGERYGSRQRRKEELVSAGWREGTALLDEFVAADTAVEVVHRSAHRPFGLSGWRRCGMRDPAAPPLAPEAEIVDAPWPRCLRPPASSGQPSTTPLWKPRWPTATR